MKLFYPDIFENFRCIGSACEDNCCKIGWDIEIDRKTLDFYKSLDNELGKRLVENIYEEDGCFYMGQSGGCPFMNDKGLCSVQLEYGEENISEICREHPRFYEWFGDYKEAGVGLCCEAVCQMIVGRQKPILFTEKEISEPDDDLEFDEKLFEGVRRVRNRLTDILQNRRFSLSQRLRIVLVAAEDIQQAVDDENPHRLKQLSGMLAVEGFLDEIILHLSENNKTENQGEAVKQAAGIFTGLDYIHNDLKELFEYVENNADRVASHIHDCENVENELEHIAVYFIYRYFIKSARDYGADLRIYTAVLFTSAVRLLFAAETDRTGRFPHEKKREWIIKEFSKEIEYSPDNAEAVENMIIDGDIEPSLIEKLL
jgi:lysine-N-methylase